MKKLRYTPPYDNQGNTRFRPTFKKSGVYLITENGIVTYIGHSRTNLYKTMYRHFQVWRHSSQEVISYAARMNRHDYKVRVVLCTPAQAMRLERALVIKYQPRDNEQKYEQYMLNFNDRKLVKDYEDQPADPLPF